MGKGNGGVLIYMMMKGRPHVVLSSSRDGHRGFFSKGIPKKHATESHKRSLEIWVESGSWTVAKSEDVKRHQKPTDMPYLLYPFRLDATVQTRPKKIDRQRRLINIKSARNSTSNNGLRKALWTHSPIIYL